MQKVEKPSRTVRIAQILEQYDGRQVGGPESTRVELDLGFILNHLVMEDEIQEQIKQYDQLLLEKINLEMKLQAISNPDLLDRYEDVIKRLNKSAKGVNNEKN